MSADVEDKYVIAQATEPLDSEGRLANDRIRARFKEEILEVNRDQVDYIDISPNNLFL